MAFEMTCNMCGTVIQVDDSRAGSIINCPSCGQVIFVHTRPDGAEPSVPLNGPDRADNRPLTLEDSGLNGDTGDPVPAALSVVPSATDVGLGPNSSLAEMMASEEPADSSNRERPEASRPTASASPPQPVNSVDELTYRVADQSVSLSNGSEFSTPSDAQAESQSLALLPVESRDSAHVPQNATLEPLGSTTTPGAVFKFAALAGLFLSGVIFGLILGKILFGK